MLTRLKKDSLKNKQLVSNLNKRMFLGFTKLKKSFKNKKINSYDEKKDYLPFEFEYQTMYKEKYLKKLKGPKLIDLSILKLNTNINKEKTISNKLLITENPKGIYTQHNKTESNLSLNKNAFKNILLDENEKKIVSKLPFFSLNKKAIDKNSKEEFLYKISHSHINTENNINKTINLYNSYQFKKKYRRNLNDLEKKPKFELKIDNLIPKYSKISIESSKERHLNFLSKNISILKSLPNLVNKSINDIIDSIGTENEQNKDEIHSINNSFKEELNNNEENNNLYKTTYINYKKINNKRPTIQNNLNSFINLSKKIKRYPPNYYSLQQLELKRKKYEEIHNEAFENLQYKINIREDYKRKLNDENSKEILRPLTLGIMETRKNKSFKKNSHKNHYLLESRIRDIIISKKLRCEFEPEDIKRILNGKKPWKR